MRHSVGSWWHLPDVVESPSGSRQSGWMTIVVQQKRNENDCFTNDTKGRPVMPSTVFIYRTFQANACACPSISMIPSLSVNFRFVPIRVTTWVASSDRRVSICVNGPRAMPVWSVNNDADELQYRYTICRRQGWVMSKMLGTASRSGRNFYYGHRMSDIC